MICITAKLVEKDFEEFKLPYRKALYEYFTNLKAKAQNAYSAEKGLLSKLRIYTIICLAINNIFKKEYFP
jgi:hypothetical protein